MKKTLKILLLSLVLLTLITHSIEFIYADNSDNVKTVLFINSYHEGYKWSDDIYDGIKSVLKSSDIKIDLQLEYMDTQRVINQQYYQSLFETYKYKFQDRNFDLILSSDEAAFTFLQDYGEVLFPNTPIVFCGVNHYEKDKVKNLELFTGVVEGFDIDDTIALALKNHPNTDTIYYVNDETTTGVSIMKEFETVIPKFSNQIKFIKLDGEDLNSIAQKSEYLDNNSLILFLIYFMDNAGNRYEYYDAVRRIEESSAVPIYGVWDFTLGYGIVGGKLTSGFYQGETAANIALRVLSGEKPSDIPVITEKTTNYQFDYAQLKKHKIKIDALPQDSIIINLEKTTKKQVLIINSYNRGLQWTDDLEAGILSSLSKKTNSIEFTHEYMDVKKNTDPVYLQNFVEFLFDKYKNKKYDLIIVTDDVAFKFITKYHDLIFKDVPTIFCGVNYFEDSMVEDKDYLTGVVESYDLKGTIDVALKINPNIKRVIVINDTTLTGQANKKNLDLLIPEYENLVFEIWEDENMSVVQSKVSKLDGNSIILLLSFNRDKSNNTFSYDESITMISKYATVPIYGVWDFYLDKGLLGGVLTTGTVHGEIVGRMAQLILDGKNPSDIPIVRNSPNTLIFDYNMLKEFDIETKTLPKDSTLINEPLSLFEYYNLNKKILNPFLYLFAVLGIVVTLMYKNIRIRKASEEKERIYALTDLLTGVPNRRAGIEYLSKLIENPNDSEYKITICFIDVNNLKKTNDEFGHLEGDELIKNTCALINNNLRKEDMLCRFGGDEFLIVFNNTTIKEAKTILHSIIEAINEQNQTKSKPYNISISYGFAHYKHDPSKESNDLNDHLIDHLIEQADNEMYRHKAAYKNS